MARELRGETNVRDVQKWILGKELRMTFNDIYLIVLLQTSGSGLLKI